MVHSFRLGHFSIVAKYLNRGRAGRGLIQIGLLCYLHTETILKLVDVARRQRKHFKQEENKYSAEISM